jgi:FkbM family methyltransferase
MNGLIDIARSSLPLPIQDFIGKYYARTFPRLYAHRYAEQYFKYEQELLLLPLMLVQGRRAIDIGTNIGPYIPHLLRYTDKVEAFEPSIHFVRFLKKAYGESINIHCCALSDSSGASFLMMAHDPKDDVSGLGEARLISVSDAEGENRTSFREEVKLNTLDSFRFIDVAFVKIDVEGHELRVLHGGIETLMGNRPTLLIEAELRHRDNAVVSIVDFLAPLNYEGFFLHRRRLHSISEFCPDLQDIKYISTFNLGENRNYINNFIFVPSERVQEFKNGCTDLLN